MNNQTPKKMWTPELGLVVCAFAIAFSGIFAGIFTYRAAINRKKKESFRFEEQMCQFQEVQKKMESQGRQREEEFNNSIRKLDNVISRLESADQAKKKDLEVRLGLTFDKINNRGNQLQGEGVGASKSPEAEAKTKALVRDFYELLTLEVSNESLIKHPLVNAAWIQFLSTISGKTFQAYGGYKSGDDWQDDMLKTVFEGYMKFAHTVQGIERGPKGELLHRYWDDKPGTTRTKPR